MELANPLPTFKTSRAVLWFFNGPGHWTRIGEITVSPAGVQSWYRAARKQEVETSWEAGIQPGWSYVFPRETGPDDFLILLA